MIFLIMGVILLLSFSLFAAERGQALEQPVTKFKWEKVTENVNTWPLGTPRLSTDKILSVRGYKTEKKGGGYLAKIKFKEKNHLFILKDPLQCNTDKIESINGKIVLMDSTCFFTACYAEGIQVNKVSDNNAPTIQVIQTITMPEARNDVSWLTFNLNTKKLAGACWQFLRIWKQVEGKDEWQLEKEIVDTEQLDIPEEVTDESTLYTAKIKLKSKRIYSLRWPDENTFITRGLKASEDRYWNITTGKQIEAQKIEKEISLTSIAYRVLLGLTED